MRMKKVYKLTYNKPGSVNVQATYGAYSGVSGSFGASVLLTTPNNAVKKGDTMYVIKPLGGGPPIVVGAA